MGDLVLTESEVEPVMMKLQQGGIEQTALHNHLLNETPRIMYMHVAGHGDPVKLASALKQALSLTKMPSAAPKSAASPHDDDAVKLANGLRAALDQTNSRKPKQ